MRKSRKRQKPARRQRNLRAGFQQLESRQVLSATAVAIDVNPYGAAAPAELTVVGDLMYFSATDGSNGRELWVTDGTSLGTRLVKDIAPGSAASTPTDLVAIGTSLYFIATDGTNGRELWKTDGTEAGTVMVRDLTPTNATASSVDNLIAVGNTLYFTANDGTNGVELWKSDGTSNGTTQVKNIAAAAGASSTPGNLTEVNGVLYFSATDGVNGRELWKSDGTASGTVMVKDINTGTTTTTSGTTTTETPRSSSPGLMTVVGNTLYFVAIDSVHGAELWKTDGTAGGTVRLTDLYAGTTNSFGAGDQLTAVGNTLFFSANDGVHGTELWKLDTATSSTPTLVKDIEPGAEGNLNDFSGFTAYNGKLYFSASDDVSGKELWVSDGTSVGTIRLVDINPGVHKDDDDADVANDSYPYYFTEVGGLLYFSAFTDATDRELWRTDGTAAGTQLVTDAHFGTKASNPTNFVEFNGGIYYTALDASGQSELHTLVNADNFRLTVSINGGAIEIPDLLGVESDGSNGAYYTLTDDGLVFLGGTGQTLGGFFDMWRTDAGEAGENAEAFLTSTRLMGSVADGTHTVQMFVNGHLVDEFGDYVLQDGDDVVLAYTSNPIVSIVTNYGGIVIELFENETPGTVDNFLTYINDGDYLNSFFHRSVEDFVIQGGGFTTSSTAFTNTSQFSPVTSNGQIDNEPGISNLRGTLAMAKIAGQPDSATSQFFVNLKDNSSLLDPADKNAFTVFGRVLSMQTVDDIAGLQINDVDGATNSAFGEVPQGANGELVVVSAIEGLGSLTGAKFLDLDGDGSFNNSDVAQSGVVVFIDQNNNGSFDAGELSTTTDANGRYHLQVTPGAYTVRAELSSGVVTTQAGYSVNVEIGREIANLNFGEQFLGAPTGVDLVDVSDTGSSDSDDLTSFNNATAGSKLTFSVTGVTAGSEVRLYAGSVLIGTATASSNQVLITTDGATTLSDGLHAITATVSLSGFESDPSAALNVTIDSTTPGGVTTALPDEARVGQELSVDLDSPDEGMAGVLYSLVGAPAGMTIDAGTGELTWTATTEQTGPLQFDVVVTDAAGNASTRTFELTTLGVIAARADDYEVDEDASLSVDAANGVLQNDGDGSIDGLTVTVVDQPAHGTVTLNADGSFTYTPEANYFGADSFTYRSTDGTDVSNVAKVTIAVNALQDAPEPVVDSYTLNEDEPLAVTPANGVLANDVDVDGDTLTATVVTGPTHGTLTFNADGSFVYTPAANYFGPDSFTYSVTDGVTVSDPVTVSLTVNSVNDNPTVTDDTYTVSEDGTLTVAVGEGVLANDSDIDSTVLGVTVVTGPAKGTLTLNADGSFTYTPNADFFGTDTFTYRTSDGAGGMNDGQVTINVTGTPDSPVAVDDSFDAPNDGTPTTLNVLANDTDPDGTSSHKITSVTTGSLGGTIVISADGRSLKYTAPLEGVGNDVFTYTMEDGDGLTSTASVVVNVYDAGSVTISGFVYVDTDNDGVRETGEIGIPGVLVTLTGVDVRGYSVSRSMLTGNDGSYSFTELSSGTYKIVESQPAAHSDGKDVTTVAGAALTNDTISNLVVSGNSVFTENNFGETPLSSSYITLAWFLASAPSPQEMFRKVVADAEEQAGHTELAATIRSGGSASQTNTSPTAAIDAYMATEDTTLTVTAANGVLANDSDAEDDTLTAAVTQSPTHGTLSLASDGSLTYTPTANYTGQDTFSYKAKDDEFSSPAVVVTITVANTNDAPVAANDTYPATAGAPLVIAEGEGVLANDTDIDGDTLAATIVTQPTNGTVLLGSSGQFTYVPNAGFTGQDSFTYRVADPSAATATATVAIQVAASTTTSGSQSATMAFVLDAFDAAFEESEDWSLAL
ncbi:Peptidyl-prolyl cis-trans isomerase A precursor [Botrimarina colliarenosi]|uniref:peptidylprolyl isomerase n=1 Tax=Botrimarina colliarenosi TaxID=2528001 RepID=A0A5C6ADU6_9BACT|nr:ELWxxDGT repeat protein [Botrimarina colliarenosi]TWT97586.1 Peptidyl-prolyl cis-trans isomerase A precursor [Botrimarina colliarenosi]